MKKTLLSIAAALALPVMAGVNTERLNISGMAVLRSDNSLTVNMRINPRGYSVKSNQEVVLTPAIVAQSDTLLLPPVTLAGRHAWYYETRAGRRGPLLARAGKNSEVEYSRTVPYEPWMETSHLDMIVATRSACDCGEEAQSLSTENVTVAEMDYAERTLSPGFRYIVPCDTIEKIFSLSGRADIRFMVGRTDIDWSYAGNNAELDSILATLAAVRDNKDASVSEIRLTGYASPEGSYAVNERLARGRTEAVKEYVLRHADFPASVYRTSSVAEDWQGLCEWLERNRPGHWEEMTAFISDASIPEATKNDAFSWKFPEAYPMLLKEVYPTLRHTDYQITYNVRKYYDLEEIRQVMLTNPRNLSQNELYLLAKSYPDDSREYFEVFSLAARMFPDDTTANLNAANAAMGSGDLAAAEMYLQRAGDSPEATYARGLHKAMNGDYAVAIPLLETALAAGVGEAEAAIAEIRSLEKAKASGGVVIL